MKRLIYGLLWLFLAGHMAQPMLMASEAPVALGEVVGEVDDKTEAIFECNGIKYYWQDLNEDCTPIQAISPKCSDYFMGLDYIHPEHIRVYSAGFKEKSWFREKCILVYPNDRLSAWVVTGQLKPLNTFGVYDRLKTIFGNYQGGVC